MKKREEIVNNSKEMSFLDFPKEIQHAIPPSVVPDEATKIKRKLLMSCTTLQGFFQVDLDKNDAERLLTYVLQGNAKEAKKMYDANPRLLFIEATAEEYAAGIDEYGMPVHRRVTESPFKAAARAGDVAMLKDMKEQFEKVFDNRSKKSGETLAKEQLAEIFPNGFKYPPSSYDFSKLAEAITSDPVLKNANGYIEPGKASSSTEKALAQFRKDFMPGSEKVGYHFNLNELAKAYEVYNKNCRQWNQYQAAAFWSQVVGYLERLVSACDAQALRQGIKNVLDGKLLERSFDLYLWLNNGKKKISYFPLDADSFCYLGGSFAIDSCFDGGVAAWRAGMWTWQRRVALVEKLCGAKTGGLEEFKHQLHKSVDHPEVSYEAQPGM